MNHRRDVHLGALCIFLLALCAGKSPGQQQADSTLGIIQTLYERGSYLSAEVESRRLLESKSLQPSARVLAEQYLAFCLVAQSSNAAAVDHFLTILEIDSSYALEPVLTSPKILAVFNQARQQRATLERNREKLRLDPAGSLPENRNVSFRTLLFPGWEQIHQGRTSKGYALLGAGALSLGATIYLDVRRRDTRDRYLAADSPDLASSRYDQYNTYHRSEYYAAVTFILIYLYSQFDAFLELPPASSPVTMQFRSGPQITARVSF